MKSRLTITILAVSLAISLCLCLYLSGCLQHSASDADSFLSFDQPLSRLEFCDPYLHDYDLTYIETGETVKLMQFPLIEAQTAPNALDNQIIYSMNGQRAIVFLDPDNRDQVVAYAVFDENRRPIKCDLTTLYDKYPCQLADSRLANIDFANSTLYDAIGQYSFVRYDDSDSTFGFTQSLILSDGRILYLEGLAVDQTESYQRFIEENPEASRSHYSSFLYENRLHIGANTYFTRVRILDIFQIPEGSVWSTADAATLYEQPQDHTTRKNSDYFLRWLQEHVPEGMTRQEVDRWIEDFRAGSEQE